MKDNSSVKKLSRLAGVSVRTLHLYDEMGLLKPLAGTAAGYRQYGRQELLRLQQILFYSELDFPLKDILDILEDPSFVRMVGEDVDDAVLAVAEDRVRRVAPVDDGQAGGV